MLAPITHVLPVTTIRRRRILPVPGKVTVRAGQKVSATDTIAEANLYPDYILLDVARGLGMSSDRADQLIQIQTGDHLAGGDIIAGPVGLSRRVVRSPSDGEVILAGGGQVLVEAASKVFKLKAGIPGDVVELLADRGAEIETSGALIQCVWGNGRIDYGVMVLLTNAPDHVAKPDELDVSLRGSIALASICDDPEVFKIAEELPLRGLILSSVPPSLEPAISKMRIPVVLLEGFGRRPMNPVTFKLLTTNERREVALNAERWDRFKGIRPEIIIPLPDSDSLTTPQEAAVFAPGQQVRVVRAPYAGEIGKIENLKRRAEFPSGLKAPAAEVHLENRTAILVPLANLELLA